MKLSDFSCNLKNKISIYVPSTCNVNQTIDNSEYVEKTACFLSKLFGGCTAQDVNGFWISDNKGMIKEDVKIVYAFCTQKDFEKHESEIIDYCEIMKNILAQEAISLEFNNELYFI